MPIGSVLTPLRWSIRSHLTSYSASPKGPDLPPDTSDEPHAAEALLQESSMEDFARRSLAPYAREHDYEMLLADPSQLQLLTTRVIEVLGDLVRGHALLLHSPVGFPMIRPSPLGDRLAWTILTKLRDRGIVSQIGVSNYTAQQLDSIMDIERPAYNQIEFNLTHQRRKLVEKCNNQGIRVVAYLLFQRHKSVRDSMNPKIERLCARRGVTIGTMMAAVCRARNIIPIILPQHLEHLREVVQCDLELTPSQLNQLSALDQQTCSHYAYNLYSSGRILGPFWDWHMRQLIRDMNAHASSSLS